MKSVLIVQVCESGGGELVGGVVGFVVGALVGFVVGAPVGSPVGTLVGADVAVGDAGEADAHGLGQNGSV
jgi:hypothetical protein